MRKAGKKALLTEIWRIRLTSEQKQKVIIKGIKGEHVRRMIDGWGGNGRASIKSDDWIGLSGILEMVPSLQLIGDIGSGKTFLVRKLIEEHKDRQYIFIVLDAHREFEFLPVVTNITPDLKHSVRIALPDAPEGSIGMYKVYHNLIVNQQFPKNYILVIEEALRYKKVGIKNLLAESRKFLKILAITQEEIADFCPSIQVDPYNPRKL